MKREDGIIYRVCLMLLYSPFAYRMVGVYRTSVELVRIHP